MDCVDNINAFNSFNPSDFKADKSDKIEVQSEFKYRLKKELLPQTYRPQLPSMPKRLVDVGPQVMANWARIFRRGAMN